MKKTLSTLIIAASLLCACRTEAAGTNQHIAIFHWVWMPTPADMGALSTNDYFTNIVFRFYSSTSATAPLSTWTKVLEIPGAPLLAQGPPGTDWTNQIVADANTRFYVMTAYSSMTWGGGESPFSNVAFQLAPLPSGTLLPLK